MMLILTHISVAAFSALAGYTLGVLSAIAGDDDTPDEPPMRGM